MTVSFSVIVPVYNCAKFLSACVDSILAQTEEDFELLLIDDGSSDESGAICERYAEQDGRIRAFHKENGGASSARNYGLERICGEYVLFIDGDDTVEPELLRSAAAAFSESRAEIVVFGMAFDCYNSAGVMERTDSRSVAHSGLVTREELLSSYDTFFLDNALSSSCNKVFSAEMIRKSGLRFREGMTLYEDLDFVLRCLAHSRELFFLDRVFYHYRLAVTEEHYRSRVSDLDALLRNLDLLTDSVLTLKSPEARQTTANLCTQLIDLHLLEKPTSRKALEKAAEAIRGCRALKKLGAEGTLPNSGAASFWNMIENGRETALLFSLQKRKTIRDVKRLVRPVLKKTGLLRR